ncbi:MAG: phenylacetate--CoA ligase family protein [Deltaproteobacteria bacterium]|nr:phenylacetate--CoA ligase family protein [Deltaproteobacteria bacterium]
MSVELEAALFSVQQFAFGLPFRLGGSRYQQILNCLGALPPGFLSALRRRAFRRVVRLAASKSAFYQRRFSECGVNLQRVRVPEDLGSFYLSSEEVRSAPESLLCDRPEIAIESSGTTGHAVRVYTNHRELEYNARQGLLLKAIYQIRAEDRILSTFDYGFCLDGLLAQKTLPYWKVFGMCVGRVDPAEIYRRLPDYRFNIVMSGTPWLSRLTEVAQAEGRPYPLKLLVGGGGGGVTRRTREWIEEFWGAPLCMTYGSTEAATLLGFECLRRDGYHVNEFDFWVEVLNPDAEGYGEIVLTTVNRSVMPLIRYRTRDVARWIPERCGCGLPFRRLSPLRGRTDEIVASVWGNVHPEFFEKILNDVPGLAEDWQVALQERESKQTFLFRLELENGGAERKDDVAACVLKAIEREHPLAWQACAQKLAGVDFLFFSKGTLRKNRKLLRLVDERRRGNG